MPSSSPFPFIYLPFSSSSCSPSPLSIHPPPLLPSLLFPPPLPIVLFILHLLLFHLFLLPLPPIPFLTSSCYFSSFLSCLFSYLLLLYPCSPFLYLFFCYLLWPFIACSSYIYFDFLPPYTSSSTAAPQRLTGVRKENMRKKGEEEGEKVRGG